MKPCLAIRCFSVDYIISLCNILLKINKEGKIFLDQSHNGSLNSAGSFVCRAHSACPAQNGTLYGFCAQNGTQYVFHKCILKSGKLTKS